MHSIKEFLRYKGCYFHGENKDILLAFLTFIANASINEEITTSITPTNMTPIFSTSTAITHDTYATEQETLHSLPPLAKHKFRKLQQSNFSELLDKLDFDTSNLDIPKQTLKQSPTSKISTNDSLTNSIPSESSPNVSISPSHPIDTPIPSPIQDTNESSPLQSPSSTTIDTPSDTHTLASDSPPTLFYRLPKL